MNSSTRFNCRVHSIGVFLAILASVAHADWPQFRGPNSSGVAVGPAPPIEFGPRKNELWKTPLASGHSSPCIWGDHIFVTTFQQPSKLAVMCFDRASGEVRWQREISVDEVEKGHPSFNPASSTPCTDGERVVAYFGSFGLICFDMAGEKLWQRPMPVAKSFGGNAASPIIVGDRVILYRGNYVDHFLLAVDKQTGDQLWTVPQDEPITGEMACTACPIIAGEKLILHTARTVQAVDIATGERLWAAKCNTTATSTPVLAGDEVIVAAWNKLGEPDLRPPFPTFDELLAEHDRDDDQTISRDELPTLWIFHRPEGAEAPLNGATVGFDWVDQDENGEIQSEEWTGRVAELEAYRSQFDAHGLLAIDVENEGLVSPDRFRTLATQGIPEVPSPVCDEQFVYFVKNGGALSCVELATSRRTARLRTGGRGTHYASPILAGDKLFTFAGDGRISVLTPGPKPKVVATNEMGDAVFATPAIVDGVIYVRTHSALYAFGR